MLENCYSLGIVEPVDGALTPKILGPLPRGPIFLLLMFSSHSILFTPICIKLMIDLQRIFFLTLSDLFK